MRSFWQHLSSPFKEQAKKSHEGAENCMQQANYKLQNGYKDYVSQCQKAGFPPVAQEQYSEILKQEVTKIQNESSNSHPRINHSNETGTHNGRY